MDFAIYKTFTWIANEPLIRPIDDRYVSPLNAQRIRKAIESGLLELGFRKVGDRAAADFIVSFTVGARDKIDVDSYPATYRDGWITGWPYYGDSIDVHTYTEGILAIDIFDRERRLPVWHGVAKKRISGSDRGNASRLIQEAVALILSEFPPQQAQQQ